MDVDTAKRRIKQTFLHGAIAGLVIGALTGAMLGWKLGQPETLTVLEPARDCEQV